MNRGRRGGECLGGGGSTPGERWEEGNGQGVKQVNREGRSEKG